MKYVIFWIEMLKQASELVGLNLHPCDSDDVQLKCLKSLQSFCEYRLKKAIRRYENAVFELGQLSGKADAHAELTGWPPEEYEE